MSAAIPKLSVGKPYTNQGKQGDIKLEVPLSLEGKNCRQGEAEARPRGNSHQRAEGFYSEAVSHPGAGSEGGAGGGQSGADGC